MLCFHKWKVKSVTITKSIYEIKKEQGFHPSVTRNYEFYKNKIAVLKCSKCGMIKEKTFNVQSNIEVEE